MIRVNGICGEITGPYDRIGVTVMCTPGPLEGNIVTVQKNFTDHLEMEELDVLVLQDLGESKLKLPSSCLQSTI